MQRGVQTDAACNIQQFWELLATMLRPFARGFRLNSHSRTTYLVYNLGRFPFVRTGQPDHYRTSYFDNEIGFFQGLLLKNHLLPTHYLGFDWSSWIVLINSEILITKGRVWPVSSDKWKAPLD